MKQLTPERKLRLLEEYLDYFVDYKIWEALGRKQPLRGPLKSFENWIISEMSKRKAYGEKMHEEMRKQRCFYCKRPFHAYNVQKTKDHIIPLSKGGYNTKENRVLCCLGCNGWKANKALKVWRKEIKSLVENDDPRPGYTIPEMGQILGTLANLEEEIKRNKHKMGAYHKIE
jgi:5-methylcytosine-specific restriction endonuclease McrA